MTFLAEINDDQINRITKQYVHDDYNAQDSHVGMQTENKLMITRQLTSTFNPRTKKFVAAPSTQTMNNTNILKIGQCQFMHNTLPSLVNAHPTLYFNSSQPKSVRVKSSN